MNLVADESIDRQIVERLRQDGHLVLYVAEIEPGLPDDAVLELTMRERALLLTADKDFGELLFRQQRLPQGLVLVRLAGLTPENKAEVVASAINKHTTKLLQAFAVITPKTIRIRQRLS